MAKKETKQTSNFEARDTADELLKKVREHEGAFDHDFAIALAQRLYAQWMGTDRDGCLAVEVAEIIRKELGIVDDELSLGWYLTHCEDHQHELIDQQEALVNEIDDDKAKMESHQEIVKSLKAGIDENHTRLRQLARSLKTPWVPPLPPTPSRQREIEFADGEEWRAVPLSEVLSSDPGLKAIAMEKLGNVTLEKYCELAQKYAVGDKPKKLTRKQWDRIEEAVQDFHAARSPEESATVADDGDDQAGDKAA